MPLSLLKVDTPSNRPSCPAIRDFKTPKHKKKTDLFISLFILLQKNPKKSLVLFQLKVIFSVVRSVFKYPSTVTFDVQVFYQLDDLFPQVPDIMLKICPFN